MEASDVDEDGNIRHRESKWNPVNGGVIQITSGEDIRAGCGLAVEILSRAYTSPWRIRSTR